jgi:hypothetical protein
MFSDCTVGLRHVTPRQVKAAQRCAVQVKRQLLVACTFVGERAAAFSAYAPGSSPRRKVLGQVCRSAGDSHMRSCTSCNDGTDVNVHQVVANGAVDADLVNGTTAAPSNGTYESVQDYYGKV